MKFETNKLNRTADTASMKDQILALRAEGKTYSEIVTLLGCAKSTVSYYCGQGQHDKTLKRSRDRRTLRKRLMQELKQKTPCADCGENYPYWVMQFDHLPEYEKLFTLGKFGKDLTLDLLETEIKKCDVVCANCHADRTHYRNQTTGDNAMLVEQVEKFYEQSPLV